MIRPAEDELRRALCATSADLAIESIESRSWASATFSGARHHIVLRFGGDGAGAAAAAFLDGLGEREFDLHGHLLADISLAAEERERTDLRLILEALTIEGS